MVYPTTITLAIRRPHSQNLKYEDLIINALIKVTNEGKAENTIRAFSHRLNQLNRNAGIKNPEEVRTAIANPINEKTRFYLGYRLR